MKTSISDYPGYRNFCQLAATNPEVFAKFRRDPVLMGIMEHVSWVTAGECIEIIQRDSPSLLAHFPRFSESETVGRPSALSPTTLRYIKVLSDLSKYFGSLDGFRVAEIGGGYGGQCKIIHDVFKPAEYTLIDLPEPLALAKRVLTTFTIPNVSFLTREELRPQNYDLVISNYALSECAPSIRAEYEELVLAWAKRGYLSVNFIGKASGIEDMTLGEIKAFHPFALDLPEDPPHPSNRLYIWGNTTSA